MLTDGDVVPDLHEIIYLRTPPNHSGAQRTAINCHVGPNLDVLPDDNIANL